MQDPNENDEPSKKKVTIRNQESRKENVNAAPLHSRPSTNSSNTTTKGNYEENFTEQENEVQVVDLQSEEKQQPLLLLFPHLRQEGVNVQKLNKKLSTTEMTKMLVGKKANFGNFKYSQKLAKHWSTFSSSRPSSGNDYKSQRLQYTANHTITNLRPSTVKPPMSMIPEIESVSDTTLPTSTKNVPRERAFSRDADAEDDDDEE